MEFNISMNANDDDIFIIGCFKKVAFLQSFYEVIVVATIFFNKMLLKVDIFA